MKHAHKSERAGCPCRDSGHQNKTKRQKVEHAGCSCGDGNGADLKEARIKFRLMRIVMSALIFLTGIIIFEAVKLDILWLKITLFLIAYAVAGIDVVYRALKNIVRGRVFDENFLMTLATAGALAIGEFPEAVAVMLFYQIGELFQSCAVGKSRKSIAKLMGIRPDCANVKEGGKIVKKLPEEVRIGDIIVVAAGEKIPLDGEVVDGHSFVDTSALTGESVPRETNVGSNVISGCINLNGMLTILVEKEFAQSTVNKILDLVENASSKKSSQESFITKFAKFYTPIVVAVAVMLAVIPPLANQNQSFTDWLYRALTFLVVSCPCALVVSIPMSFFGGIGGASRIGVLVKGGNYLEVLAKTDTVVFDKTGTLTKGVFKVQSIAAINLTQEQLLEYAAYAESYSNHPISLSLKEAYKNEIDKSKICGFNEIAGCGVTAVIDGKTVAAGNGGLMKKYGISFSEEAGAGTIVHVAIDGLYAGNILIADQIKEDSYRAIKELKAAGIRQTVMLTGDCEETAKKVARELGIDKVYAELLPENKVEKLEQLFDERKDGKIAFVGDGINDAPVLARADLGVAMGGLGSDAAIEAADVVIMTDEPSKIAQAKRIAKKTLNIALQNTVFAIAVKTVVLILSVFGIANMWMAIFADVGVTVLAVLNVFRTLNINKKHGL